MTAAPRLYLVAPISRTSMHDGSGPGKVADVTSSSDRQGILLGVHEPDPLLARVARGDDSAFGEFYDQVAPAVYGTVLQVVRDPSIAEETTQDVFVELWRLAPRYDASKGSPRRWAVTVAHRRAVDRVRSEQAARTRDDVESRRSRPDLDTVADEVVDAMTGQMDRARVAAALRRLTEPQREALTLAYYGGHTYREVAVLLDVPEGTVKTRIRDALIKLRDLMGITP